MSPELLTMGMFGTLVALIMLGVSLSYALGGVAVVFTLILHGPDGLFPMVAAVFETMWSILLAAIPLFVFMGVALARSQVSRDLYQAFYVWSGRVNGGLLLGTTGFAAVLSAMTGSCAASTLTTGMVGMPSMEKRGYNRQFVLGTIGAAGTLGILIPPSITLIVIGMTTGLSVGKLFMGGLVSGLIILAVILAYVALRARLDPSSAPGAPVGATWKEKVLALKAVIPPLGIIVVVLASIFLGLATPTEASAVGALAVTVAIAARGEVTREFIRDVTYTTASTTGMAIWIVFGATAFVSVYSGAGGIKFMQDFLFALDLGPWALIVFMQLIALVLGMFLDPIGIILMALPVFYPMVVKLGFDPLWFCVIFQVNLCIGYITPPFGYNIFYLKSLSPETSIYTIYRSLFPFVFLMLACGAVFLAFPSILTQGVAFMMGG
ncbi:TRAP transporter large permease [Melaminivora alkalimesophila]|uniref:TRAP transporter large permease protein n=1 Tax=Melaminivora alkalimesophila TaxID=1165852 RepID=A0A317RFE6_9BURK|nr:TRAP transporter large permease subunit [Melaminivora alkalimesophila]PWW48934.1 tripartite ATP-independent transporter DctM subunit [Melaminivora alkalimesophila]